MPLLNQHNIVLLNTHFPAWDKLSLSQQQMIIRASKLSVLPAKSPVHSSAMGCSGLLIVKQGALRVYTLSEEGRDITLYRLKTGDICILSASCVLPDISLDIFIETLADSKIIQILPDTFGYVMQNNIYLEAQVYKLATSRLCKITRAMQQMIFIGFDKRLASFLLSEAQDGEVKMTHEQIAKLMGTAREVVTRMLKDFSERGWVELMRGRIKIIDEKSLSRKISSPNAKK